jgi:nucleoside-diphosphate kinase
MFNVLGLDRVKNAIHCTDLPEDGVLEVNFIIFLD